MGFKFTHTYHLPYFGTTISSGEYVLIGIAASGDVKTVASSPPDLKLAIAA